MSMKDKRIEFGSDKTQDRQKALREAGTADAGFLETVMYVE